MLLKFRRTSGALVLVIASIAGTATCLAPDRLTAQGVESSAIISPLNDLIVRATTALNALRYDDALALAREAMGHQRVRQMQQLTLDQIMAAAFFPDPADGPVVQNADSAKAHLRNALILRPDMTLGEMYKWPGLDSIFNETRDATFAAVARPSAENALTGADGRSFVEVISTRKASMYLRSRSKADGILVLHDSSMATNRSRLALRAHDGTRALFSVGEYDILIDVRDWETGEVMTLSFSAVASGLPLITTELPTLDSSRLKPERRQLTKTRGIVTGLIIGSATVALSLFARADEPVRSAFPADARAKSVGALIAAGAIAGGVFDKGTPLAANVAANALTRAEHTRAVAAAQEANRQRVSDYRIELTIRLVEDR